MIILDATTKTIEIVTTAAIPVVISYVDVTTTAYTPASTDTATVNGTATILAAPAASTQRQVKLTTIYNSEAGAIPVAVQLNNTATTTRVIVSVLLGVGSTLMYTDGKGWYTLTSAGAIVQSTLSPMTSAQLAAILSDETGTGLAVFNTSPTFSTNISTPAIVSPAALTITPAAGNNVSVDLSAGGGFIVSGARQDGTVFAINTGNNVPASSGSTQNGGFRIAAGTGNVYVLDFGVSGSGAYAWLQVSNNNNLAAGFAKPLVLQPVGGHVLIGTTTDSAQLTVQSDAAGTIGLVVNSAASPTANSAEFRNNGTAVAWIAPTGAYVTKFSAGAGHKSFAVQTGGSAEITSLVTADVTTADSSVIVHVRMIVGVYSNNGAAMYDGYAYAYNSGPTYTVVGVDVTKAIFGVTTAPTLAWSGSGTSRTLQVTNNATYSMILCQVSVATRYGSYTFV